MDGEDTNLPAGGSDNAQPSDALDTALEAMFDNEGEAHAPNSGKSGKEPATDDDETGDALENGEETGNEDDGEHDEDGDGDEPDPDAETMVTLADGTELSLKELKGGYLRQGDYQKKTQELANQRKEAETKLHNLVEQETAFSRQHQQLQTTLDGLVDYLANRLPEEPSATLAMTNPAEYTRQKAMYESAVGELQTILSARKQAEVQGDHFTYQQHQKRLAAENEALEATFPHIKNAEKREAFNKDVAETAAQLGFTAEELNTVVDHRVLKLAYYARIGLKAIEQQKAGKKRLESAPALKPGKNRPSLNPSGKALQNFKQSRSVDSAKKALDAFDWS